MFRRLALFACLFALIHSSLPSAHAIDLLRAQGDVVMWAPAPAGSVTVVTYATLTQSYTLPGGQRTLSADNCGGMRPFAEIVASSGGISDVMAKVELRAAFDAWESVAGLKFVEVGELEGANIILGALDGAKGRAFANLSLRTGQDIQPIAKALSAPGAARTSPPAETTGAGTIAVIEQAYVCFNPSVPWKVGFDGDLDVYDLRYAFMHEIGHAIGLDHPGRSGAIMGFRYDERMRSLQPLDIAAAQWLYGPPARN